MCKLNDIIQHENLIDLLDEHEPIVEYKAEINILLKKFKKPLITGNQIPSTPDTEDVREATISLPTRNVLLTGLVTPPFPISTPQPKMMKIKYPQIQMPAFKEDLDKWSEWWELFRIYFHQRKDILPVNKLYFWSH